MNTRFVILIAGPTAVGKTAMAINVARTFHTEIISADSRQCYRELNIGVARPSEEELAAVKHHFIATHSVQDELTAASYEQYALSVSETLFKNNSTIVITGGTGLYIRAFLEGLDAVPAVPADLRRELTRQYNENGRDWLIEELTKKDTSYAAHGDLLNPQRMLRALEVWECFGKSILSYHENGTKPRPFKVIRIGLDMPREDLYKKINIRVEQMIVSGLIEEVQGLEKFKQLSPLQTVGYRELFPYLNGDCTKDRAVELIQQNTRHYAKRQLTWFRNQERLQWFDPSNTQAVINFINQELKKEF
ncbi:MAG: tRNA (adenosine(37)-N6)-dimethylallyltransferase MiaA [Bacteroidota bacterium]